MLGVLVVDDEKLACVDILYKVSRSGLEFKWIMEASSGEDALLNIKRYRPDLLITDIAMGEMNGIDLVREAKKQMPDMDAVLVSGYSEFHLARDAISLRVADYLLKPVRQEELTKTLMRVLDRRADRASEYTKRPGTALNDRLEAQLSAFLCGMRGNLGFGEQELFPTGAGYYQIGIVRIRGKASDRREKMNRMRCLEKLSTPWTAYFPDPASVSQTVLICSAQNKPELKKKVEELFEKMKCKTKDTMVAGMSSAGEGVTSSMLNQARQTLDLRFSRKEEQKHYSRIYYWEDFQSYGPELLPEEEIRLLRRLLKSGDVKKALNVVREIFENDSSIHIRMVYTELMRILARVCMKNSGGKVLSLLGTQYMSGAIIDEFEDREELVESLCRTITLAMKEWNTDATDMHSIVHHVKQYIDDNFSLEDIGTNYLAKEFCISEGYLSTSFNREYEISLSKYITKLRINYAKKLLKETQLGICEVAKECGFRSISYFMRRFKECVGVTANEFRTS